jgi:hypothetical protein
MQSPRGAEDPLAFLGSRCCRRSTTDASLSVAPSQHYTSSRLNADIPPQSLMYVTVADVEESARKCAELGRRVIAGPRDMGKSRFCVIEDPAGAVMALVTAPG